MRLDEAKKILKNNGFILEDTETLDDEVDYLKTQNTKASKNKLDKVMDRAYAGDLEKKVLNAQNYNIKQFFAGLEEMFDEYLMNWKRNAYYYDTKRACQSVEYFFNDLMFVVKYFDEAGYIQVSLEDNKVLKSKKFKLTRVDENTEEVYDWIYSTMEEYEA